MTLPEGGSFTGKNNHPKNKNRENKDNESKGVCKENMSEV